jgi:hypothetical protein
LINHNRNGHEAMKWDINYPADWAENADCIHPYQFLISFSLRLCMSQFFFWAKGNPSEGKNNQ